MKKRILSIVLAICLVLAFVPQMVFAAGAGNPYIYKEGTAGAGESEGPGMLIDGAGNTKWCVTNFSSAYIIFETSSAVNVSGYSITTGNDNAENKGRNPKNWKLYGCNNYTGSGTGTWEEIHSVTNDTVLKDVNNTTYNFVFDKTETAYQYYKLEITSIQSGDVMQMSEFALTDCNHSWYTSKTEPTCTTAGNTTKTCTVCKGTDSVYLKPVEHDFTGEGGKCKTCGYTADELYVDENGMLCPVNGNTKEITEGLTAWNNTDTNGGWYIVKKDVTLNSATVSGNVHLILADGCNLKVNGDITGGSLTIYGQSGGSGSLTVSGSIISGHGENGGIVHAGSTGLPGGSGGNLTINGGMIKATSIKSGNGGDGGTGDGGSGDQGGDGGNGGNITINGGKIEADSITGGDGGKGRGTFSSGGNGGSGGSITINGGIVETTSITSGTGGSGGSVSFGLGNSGSGGSGGNITINGGLVEVTNFTGGSGGNGGTGGYAGSAGSTGSIAKNNGIVFQGDSGQVYGTSVTLSGNFTLLTGKTLTIDSGKTLIIPDGVTLTNNGTIDNSGKIYVDGTFTGTAGNLYYPLTLVNATANENTSEYNSKNYAKAGSTITLSAEPQVGKTIIWDSSLEVDINDNSFTMPAAALTVTAQYIEDITKPVISGIEDGKTYCAAQTVTVTDNDFIQSITVNGSDIDLVNNQFTLSPADEEQIITATDKAGNSTTMSVTVNNGHTYEWQDDNGQYWQKCKYCGDETAKKDIPTITINGADTVCITQDYQFSFTLPEGTTDAESGYKFTNNGGGIKLTAENGMYSGVLESQFYDENEISFKLKAYAKTTDGFVFSAEKTVAIQNEHAGGVATCIDLAICDTCGEEYGELDSTNHNLEKISATDATVTETGNTEYWHCLDCDKYFADENATNEIKLDDTVISKLPPEIIEGKGQSITAGEKKELTFKSNAAFSDFIRVELDGKTLDEKNYTVKEGSTVVTLKADYVAALSAGEHTIGIVSESGIATATFTVSEKTAADDDTNPPTGDNSHMALWIALLFVSGCLLTVSVIKAFETDRKRRNKHE